MYRFQGIALPKEMFLNHFAYGILEKRATLLVRKDNITYFESFEGNSSKVNLVISFQNEANLETPTTISSE